MPPKEQFPVTVLAAMDDAMAARIEQWRKAQPEIPSKREAIRQLLDAGLVSEGIA